MTAAIVEREALLLPERERAMLADKLLQTLSQPSPAVENVWSEEAEARLDAFESGSETASDVSDVVRRLRSRFG